MLDFGLDWSGLDYGLPQIWMGGGGGGATWGFWEVIIYYGGVIQLCGG